MMTVRQVSFMQRLDQLRARIAEEKERVLATVPEIGTRVEAVTMLDGMDKIWGEVESLVVEAAEKGFGEIPSDRLEFVLAAAEEDLG